MILAYKCQDRRPFFKLWNNPRQLGKLGAEDRSCFFLCPKKSALYEWATTRLYHVFQTIVTVLVALCAQLILSAINLMLSLDIKPNVEPGLSGFIAEYKNQN